MRMPGYTADAALHRGCTVVPDGPGTLARNIVIVIVPGGAIVIDGGVVVVEGNCVCTQTERVCIDAGLGPVHFQVCFDVCRRARCTPL